MVMNFIIIIIVAYIVVGACTFPLYPKKNKWLKIRKRAATATEKSIWKNTPDEVFVLTQRSLFFFWTELGRHYYGTNPLNHNETCFQFYPFLYATYKEAYQSAVLDFRVTKIVTDDLYLQFAGELK